jgi:hypothetical protein
LVGNNDHLRKGIDWFIENEPDAYMKLLDWLWIYFTLCF